MVAIAMRKKPVVIEAVQFDGRTYFKELGDFIGPEFMGRQTMGNGVLH